MALLRCCVVVLSLNLVAAVCEAAQVPAHQLVDTAGRATARQQRVNIAKGYAEEKRRAESAYITSLNGTVRWLVTLNAQADARKVLDEIKTAGDATSSSTRDLEKLIDGIKETRALETAKDKELDSRLKSAKKMRADALTCLANKCYDYKLMGYAYDLMWEIINNDPDNAIAWSAMNRVKTDKGWRTNFEATQERANLVYVKNAGWVPKVCADRVEKGEWFENGRWMTLTEADTLHSRIENPWIIETDNFTLKSSAPRKEAIKIAERLEATRQLCFRRYLEFFARGATKKSTGLLFNQTSEKKMLVHYFGGQEEFKDLCRKTSTGKAQEVLLRSAGFYSTQQHASFFYYDPNFGYFLNKVTQHEVTHQILGEFGRGGGGPTWLHEGVAEVLEHAEFEGSRLVMPMGMDIPDVATAVGQLKCNSLLSVGALLSMSHDEFHREPDRQSHYQTAGAFCCFMLECKEGAYAADFLEYLYDAYAGRNANLSDYVGLDVATLDREFRAYLQAAETTAATQRESAVAKSVQRAADAEKSAASSSKSSPGGKQTAETPKKAHKNIFEEFEEEQDPLKGMRKN